MKENKNAKYWINKRTNPMKKILNKSAFFIPEFQFEKNYNVYLFNIFNLVKQQLNSIDNAKNDLYSLIS
jgi:hypothetical protein